MATTQQKRTCFVISPIGEENSPIRQAADDLFELVIEPAVDKYNFEVIRADRIPRTSAITGDVIQLVQTSDLCIIDLTGHNPNVFYECGRRHETGRPYIHLIKKGEHRPFDLAGIRDIAYDLSTPRSVHECKVAIQAFIDELEKVGFTPTASGESLSSVVAAVDRLERKLSQLLSVAPATGQQLTSITGSESFESLMQNPLSGYAEAITSGDFVRAERFLLRLEPLLGVGQSLLEKAAILVPAGSAAAVRIVERCLGSDLSGVPVQLLKVSIGVLINHYSILDKEAEILNVVEPIIRKVIAEHDLSDQDKAFLWNQLGKVYAGMGNAAKASEFEEEAVRLDPDEAAYAYNLSMSYDKLGLNQKAHEMVERYASDLDRVDDDDHLSHAVGIYLKSNEHAKARRAFDRLVSLHPVRAKMLLMANESARKVFGAG